MSSGRLCQAFLLGGCLMLCGQLVWADKVGMKLERSHLVLGQNETVEVRVKVPAGATSLKLQAALGRVDQVQQRSERLFTAVYHPPSQFVPGVDVVLAKVQATDGTKVAMGLVLLHGKGEARIELPPNSTTFLRIGSKRFGPTTSDKHGKARIVVEVPPGVDHGLDDRGTAVSLAVPPTPGGAIFVESVRQRSEDAPSRVTLLVAMYTPKGRWLPRTSQPERPIDCGDDRPVDCELIGAGRWRCRVAVSTMERGEELRCLGLADSARQFERQVTLAIHDEAGQQVAVVPDSSEPASVKPTGERPDETVSADRSVGYLEMGASVQTRFRGWVGGEAMAGGGLWLGLGKHLLGVGLAGGFWRWQTSSQVTVDSGQLEAHSTTMVVPLNMGVQFVSERQRLGSFVAGVAFGPALTQNRNRVADIGQTERGAAFDGKLFLGGGVNWRSLQFRAGLCGRWTRFNLSSVRGSFFTGGIQLAISKSFMRTIRKSP